MSSTSAGRNLSGRMYNLMIKAVGHIFDFLVDFTGLAEKKKTFTDKIKKLKEKVQKPLKAIVEKIIELLRKLFGNITKGSDNDTGVGKDALVFAQSSDSGKVKVGVTKDGTVMISRSAGKSESEPDESCKKKQPVKEKLNALKTESNKLKGKKTADKETFKTSKAASTKAKEAANTIDKECKCGRGDKQTQKKRVARYHLQNRDLGMSMVVVESICTFLQFIWTIETFSQLKNRVLWSCMWNDMPSVWKYIPVEGQLWKVVLADRQIRVFQVASFSVFFAKFDSCSDGE